MASILILDGGRKLDVDRFFSDGGRPPVYALLGGTKTILEPGQPPRVTIYQRGKDFFTLDGQPVTEAIARTWLDDPDFPKEHRPALEAFVARLAAGKKPKEKVSKIRKRAPERKREVPFNPADAGVPTERAERV